LSSGYFKLDSYLNSADEIEETFKKGKIKLVIIFDKKFSENITRYHSSDLQIIADATDPNTANTLINYTQSIVRDFVVALNKGKSSQIMILPEVRFRYNQNLKGVFLFVPGLITIILMLVTAMMTSISLTREKEMGTMEVLLASPMKPFQIIIAKVIPYIFLALLISMVVLILAFYVFGVPIKGSLALLLFELLIFVLTTLSLGILISTVAKTQLVALMISVMGLLLPTIILSGFIFPIENMPKILQWISVIIPAKWFIIIVKDIMLKGSGIDMVWRETLVIMGFAMFFIFMSLKKFNIRLG
jgi:ABC-2 type transport system permease protein